MFDNSERRWVLFDQTAGLFIALLDHLCCRALYVLISEKYAQHALVLCFCVL